MESHSNTRGDVFEPLVVSRQKGVHEREVGERRSTSDATKEKKSDQTGSRIEQFNGHEVGKSHDEQAERRMWFENGGISRARKLRGGGRGRGQLEDDKRGKKKSDSEISDSDDQKGDKRPETAVHSDPPAHVKPGASNSPDSARLVLGRTGEGLYSPRKHGKLRGDNNSSSALVSVTDSCLVSTRSCLQWIWLYAFNTPETRSRTGSKMIHPDSRFYICEQIGLALLLLYTAILTPYTVSFYWTQDACQPMPTLNFDIAVDSYFLLDIVLTFFVGIFIEGKYVDQQKIVAKNYMCGSFCFDFVTSFPVSFLEKIVVSTECNAADDVELSPAAVRVLRIVKPLRLFKLFRILKVLQTLKIADALAQHFRIAPGTMRVAKVFVGIALGVHVCSCIFWLCKQISNTVEELDEYVVKHQIGDEDSDKYALCFYFMTTIFTTVGFGDIVAMTNTERIYIIFVMYMGSIVFGVLLAEMQEVVMRASNFARAKEAHIQALMDFMGEYEMPRAIETDVMRWAKFDFDQKHATSVQSSVLQNLPQTLKRKLLEMLHDDILGGIPVLNRLARIAGNDLIIDLYSLMKREVFYEKAIMLRSGCIADRLIIISTGSAELKIMRKNPEKRISSRRNSENSESDIGDSEENLKETSSTTGSETGDTDAMFLTKGDHFGEQTLMGETDWGAKFPGFCVTMTAVNNVICTVLTRENFQETMLKFPIPVQNEFKELKAQYWKAKQKQETYGMNARLTRVCLCWAKICSELLDRHKSLDKGASSKNLFTAMVSSVNKPVTTKKHSKNNSEELASVKTVEVTLCSARNLPHVDGWMGTCDAFVELVYKDQTQTSTVKKNSLNPDWKLEEKFKFDLSSDKLEDMRIQLKDWNMTQSTKLLGTTVIGVNALKRLIVGDKAAFPSDKFLITAPDGKPLMGKNQQQTHLVLKFELVSADGGGGGGGGGRFTLRELEKEAEDASPGVPERLRLVSSGNPASAISDGPLDERGRLLVAKAGRQDALRDKSNAGNARKRPTAVASTAEESKRAHYCNDEALDKLHVQVDDLKSQVNLLTELVKILTQS